MRPHREIQARLLAASLGLSELAFPPPFPTFPLMSRSSNRCPASWMRLVVTPSSRCTTSASPPDPDGYPLSPRRASLPRDTRPDGLGCPPRKRLVGSTSGLT